MEAHKEKMEEVLNQLIEKHPDHSYFLCHPNKRYERYVYSKRYGCAMYSREVDSMLIAYARWTNRYGWCKLHITNPEKPGTKYCMEKGVIGEKKRKKIKHHEIEYEFENGIGCTGEDVIGILKFEFLKIPIEKRVFIEADNKIIGSIRNKRKSIKYDFMDIDARELILKDDENNIIDYSGTTSIFFYKMRE